MEDKLRWILEEYRKAGNPHDNITTNYYAREKELLDDALRKIGELSLTEEEIKSSIRTAQLEIDDVYDLTCRKAWEDKYGNKTPEEVITHAIFLAQEKKRGNDKRN